MGELFIVYNCLTVRQKLCPPGDITVPSENSGILKNVVCLNPFSRVPDSCICIVNIMNG